MITLKTETTISIIYINPKFGIMILKVELSKVLSHNFPYAKSLFVVITLHKKKWLSNCSYILHNSIKNHLEIINRTLDTFNTKYKNILIPGNFNVYADVETMKNFAVPMVYIVSTNSQCY